MIDLSYNVPHPTTVANQLFPQPNPPSEDLLFFSYDLVTGFNITGSDLADAWYTFTFQLVATDSMLGLTDSSFQLKVTTSADCTQVTGFTLLEAFPASLAYEIGSAQQTTILPAAIDSYSQTSGINEICGPIGYLVNQTDAAGSITSVIPAFASFNDSTRALIIGTTDMTLIGTLYLSYDVFLINFAGLTGYLQFREVITVSLTRPICQSIALTSTPIESV
jgi:hypothetical protein